MVESSRKPRDAGAKDTEAAQVSQSCLYDLKEFDIKKEYLLGVVLPFARGCEANPVDLLVRDRAGFGYVRRLVAERLQGGRIGLYEITFKRRVPVSEYCVSFNAEGMIYAATEDRNFGERHVSVVYEVNEKRERNMSTFEAHPSSLIVIFKQETGDAARLYMRSGAGGSDMLEEKKFANNFALLITLRSDTDNK